MANVHAVYHTTHACGCSQRFLSISPLACFQERRIGIGPWICLWFAYQNHRRLYLFNYFSCIHLLCIRVYYILRTVCCIYVIDVVPSDRQRLAFHFDRLFAFPIVALWASRNGPAWTTLTCSSKSAVTCSLVTGDLVASQVPSSTLVRANFSGKQYLRFQW